MNNFFTEAKSWPYYQTT